MEAIRLMNEKINVDIRMYLIIALGINDYLYEDIENIYSENKLEYYKCYKESVYYNCPMFSSFTTKKHESIKKIAGIIQWEYSNRKNDIIYSLIKKGYKFTWNYLKNREKISVKDLIQTYDNKFSKVKDVTEMELIANMIIAMYMCSKENKIITVDDELGRVIERYFVESQTNCFLKKTYFSDEQIKENRAEIDRLYQIYDISKNIKMSLDNLFEKFIEKDGDKTGYLDTLTKRDASFGKGITKYIGALAGWIKTLDINDSEIFTNIFINSEKMDKYFLEYIYAKADNKLTEDDRDQFLISIMTLDALIYEYKLTKDKYLSGLNDDFYYEIDKLQSEVKIKEKKIVQKEENLKIQKSKIEEENNKLQEELTKLQKENSAQKRQLEQIEDNQKELNSLREYIFSLQSEDDEDLTPSENEDLLQVLSTKKYAVTGGSQSWQKKIKECIPNVIVINQENHGRDISFLDNIEALFINTANFNHAFYKKIMSRMNKNNTKLFYINGNKNAGSTIKYMYNQMCGEK